MTQQTAGAVKESVRKAKLDPWPLDRAQVIEGDPRASGTVLWKSGDSKLANGIWECTPGVFDWLHADETGFVVEGSVTVTPEGGEPIRLGPGDVFFFPEGTKARWEVHETIRKAWHLRSSEELPF